MLFCCGTCNVFFKHGPMSRNGILSWWVPMVVFGIWLVLITLSLLRAVNSNVVEVDQEVDARKAAAGAPTNAEFADQVTQLQAQVDELRLHSTPAVP